MSYSSRYSTVIVTDDRPYRSSSTDSRYTMSSGGRSGLGADSNSYNPSGSSQRVVHESFRDHRSDGYTGDSYYRSSSSGKETITHNHYARGHEEYAPTPGYKTPSSRSEKKRDHKK